MKAARNTAGLLLSLITLLLTGVFHFPQELFNSSPLLGSLLPQLPSFLLSSFPCLPSSRAHTCHRLIPFIFGFSFLYRVCFQCEGKNTNSHQIKISQKPSNHTGCNQVCSGLACTPVFRRDFQPLIVNE